MTLIRLIVYGKDVNSVTGGGGGGDIEQSRSLLINEKKEFDDKPLIDSDGSVDGTGGIGGQANRREKIILFFTCFFGLHCSYLIWGVYQEKIMTTEYLLSINSTQFLKKINGSFINIILLLQSMSFSFVSSLLSSSFITSLKI